MLNKQFKRIFVTYGYPVLIVGFILLGTHQSLFSLMAFIILALLVLIKDDELIIPMLMFVMPLATIFKYGPGGQSFFTYILLEYVLIKLLNTKGKLNKNIIYVFFFVLFGLCVQIGYGGVNITRNIKFIPNLIFLFFVSKINIEKLYVKIFKSYISGVVVSSFIALMDSSFFRIGLYVSQKDLSQSLGYGDKIRFSGLYGDPNYYTINIVIALCLIVILLHVKEISKIISVILTFLLVYFSIMTYSKSALLMLVFPLVFYIYSNWENKNLVGTLIIVLLSVLFLIKAFSGEIAAFDIVMSRMKKANDLNSLTTGRFNIWVSYLQYISSHIWVLLFGRGLSANLILVHAPHNTYIDLLYYMGVVGSCIYIFLITVPIRMRKIKINRTLLNYSIFIVIICMYIFLSELFYYDSIFHILLAIMVYNTKIVKK